MKCIDVFLSYVGWVLQYFLSYIGDYEVYWCGFFIQHGMSVALFKAENSSWQQGSADKRQKIVCSQKDKRLAFAKKDKR